MAILRKYRCPDCQTVFDFWHPTGHDLEPDCPGCKTQANWEPTAAAIVGAHSKAMDIMQNVAEQQFGLTDFKDSTREGESAVKLTPVQSDMAKPFWEGGAHLAPGAPPVANQTLLAGAKQGFRGPDPIGTLHSGMKAKQKRGESTSPFRVIGEGERL